MGGSAFSAAPYLLKTPRMLPAVYQEVKSTCLARLRELYVYVASPIEGPGKQDHGDIDIMVFLERQILHSSRGSGLPHPRTGQEPLAAIAAALGAEHTIYNPHGASTNMAIPWPDEDDGADDAEEGQHDPDGLPSAGRRRHIQVDVRIALSPQEFHWSLFRHAHGDFWQIVGSTLRPLGLTVDEEALWIRIPEVERDDRRRAKVQLTTDPTEILRFFRYDGCSTAQHQQVAHETGSPGVWEQPFASVEDLFRYITTNRFFWLRSSSHQPEKAHPQLPPTSTREHTAPPAPSPSTSNDRRRMKQRAVYAEWTSSFLPSLSNGNGTPTINHSFSFLSEEDRRAAVREEAFARWPAARREYAARLEAWVVAKALDAEKRKVVAMIKELALGSRLAGKKGENWANCLVGALKKIVLKGDEGFGVPPPVRDARGLLDLGAVRGFIEAVAEDVGDEAWRQTGAMLREKKMGAVAEVKANTV